LASERDSALPYAPDLVVFLAREVCGCIALLGKPRLVGLAELGSAKRQLLVLQPQPLVRSRLGIEKPLEEERVLLIELGRRVT
jgi:hypothetical protein